MQVGRLEKTPQELSPGRSQLHCGGLETSCWKKKFFKLEEEQIRAISINFLSPVPTQKIQRTTSLNLCGGGNPTNPQREAKVRLSFCMPPSWSVPAEMQNHVLKGCKGCKGCRLPFPLGLDQFSPGSLWYYPLFCYRRTADLATALKQHLNTMSLWPKVIGIHFLNFIYFWRAQTGDVCLMEWMFITPNGKWCSALTRQGSWVSDFLAILCCGWQMVACAACMKHLPSAQPAEEIRRICPWFWPDLFQSSLHHASYLLPVGAPAASAWSWHMQ